MGRAGVSLRLPLFEGGANRSLARSNQSQAQAAAFKREDVAQELESLFAAAQDVLSALDVETALATELSAKAAQAAELTYRAYNAGAVTFLEVDDANLSALQSKLMLSELNIRRLNGLAVLDSLGK